MTIKEMGMKAKDAAATLAVTPTKQKTDALRAIADALEQDAEEILAQNALDVDSAREAGMREVMIDRLALTRERISGCAKGVRDVAAQSDPVGEYLDMKTLPNGLTVGRVRVPLGVVGMIYESRPNVTSDAACLCLMAGNAVILRGGKEAHRSNMAITKSMRRALAASGLPEDAVQQVDDISRDTTRDMMRAVGLIDVLIPRGGAGLISAVRRNARVPVIETGTGVCHVYVDDPCDIDMAVNIVYNAKTSRPSVCNAIEGLVVAKSIAKKALPAIKDKLDEKNVELRGDAAARRILPGIIQASKADYDTEFLDYILTVKVVGGIDEAIDFINRHSTHHSECIVTKDVNHARLFTSKIDSAAVYVNASTRYTDGGELGLGAEIGISTQKLHARGPMGVRELTSYKFIINGDGQVR